MPKSSTRSGPERFSFKGEKGTRARVENLRTLTNKLSETEVFRDALSVYESLITASGRGVRFFFEDPETGERGYIWLLPGPPPFSKKPK